MYVKNYKEYDRHIIAENVQPDQEVTNGYGFDTETNTTGIVADLVQYSRNGQHVAFEWEANT